MKPYLTLEIEPLRTVADAAQEAQSISDALNRGCGFTFNGVRCVAVPGGSAERLSQAQQEAQRSRFVVHSDTIKIETEIAEADNG